jgi:hypothetical protein
MNYPPSSHNDIIDLFKGGILNPLIDPSTMFRTKDFDKLGGYSLDKECYLVPDMDLWLRALIDGKRLANFPMPLIRYRVNPEGMTNKYKREMIFYHCKLLRKYMPIIVNNVSTKQRISSN